ncbi:response regulator [Terrilactibacillus sp. BCM23-1]|uniref:Response regulator n=1 Tax=Terrilactibacillus tamarindi TaxID=2599694 RepID=A0A6N8CSN0_9BACI|nr:response regulator transcription factor [Terrilactibacillus tamarindi]MTT33199.1 response regulator [Terrilactibacillus tamarindi]
MTRVLIADDHNVVRRGLVFFLNMQKDIEIVGEARDGKEAVEKAKLLLPDLVLIDLNMPVMNGIEATRAIKQSHGQIKILILTSFSDQDHVLPAIEAGADGYQLKDIEPDVLIHSIHAVMQGENDLHPKATTEVLKSLSSKNKHRPIDDLTKREKDVLGEIVKGKSNKEIASALFISEKTVKTHVTNILSKLELADRTQAAVYAVKSGFFK